MQSEHHKEKFAGVWCPAEVLLSTLSDGELRLWLRIRSYQGTESEWCWASNGYLAREMGGKKPESEVNISRLLAKLIDAGFIAKRFNDDEGGRREIKAVIPALLNKNVNGSYQKCYGGLNKNVNIEYKGENTKENIASPDALAVDPDLETFKAEYDPAMKNRNTLDAIAIAWNKAKATGATGEGILGALRRKKARLEAFNKRLAHTPGYENAEFESPWSYPVAFLIPSKGRAAGWMAVGEMPKSPGKQGAQPRRQTLRERFPAIAGSLWQDLIQWQATDDQLKHLNANWWKLRDRFNEFDSREAWWAMVKEEVHQGLWSEMTKDRQVKEGACNGVV